MRLMRKPIETKNDDYFINVASNSNNHEIIDLEIM